MKNFQFRTPGNIICRTGSSADPGTFQNLSLTGKTLLVTDKNLSELGISEKVKQAILEAGIEMYTFDEVEPEPKVETVRKLVDHATMEKVSSVIGLGGGSPMDVAKMAALLISHPQPIPSMYGVGNAVGTRLPLILIPTTAGTGSEGTPVAVVTGDDGEKSPVVGPQFICDHVILDAELTLGLPPQVTAATGIDAMVHAIEAFTSSVRKNPLSDHLAVQALQLLYGNIRKVINRGDDLEARENMLIGSMMAGLAFANSTVGAVHALAYPLGTQFKLSHGESNAAVLTAVMRYNLKKASSLYAEIWNSLVSVPIEVSDLDASMQFITELEQLIPGIGLKDRLSSYGILESDLSALTRGTLKQERLLSYNIEPMGEEDIYKIFKSVL
jgi:alcohol dehydrogenase class IV